MGNFSPSILMIWFPSPFVGRSTDQPSWMECLFSILMCSAETSGIFPMKSRSCLWIPNHFTALEPVHRSTLLPWRLKWIVMTQCPACLWSFLSPKVGCLCKDCCPFFLKRVWLFCIYACRHLDVRLMDLWGRLQPRCWPPLEPSSNLGQDQGCSDCSVRTPSEPLLQSWVLLWKGGDLGKSTWPFPVH